jgi:hypothetical protein
VKSVNRAPRRQQALATISVLGAVAAAAVVIAKGIAAARSGRYDPSLASRMGSDAIKFPIQLAYVVPFAAVLGSIGFIVGRRVIELQLGLSAVLAGLSTFLFNRGNLDVCQGVASIGSENAFDLTVAGASLLFAVALGLLSGRQQLPWSEQAAACLALVATMVVIAHVQMWHCAPSSQQIGREWIAPITAVFLFGSLILASATLGWFVGRRALRRTAD